MLILLGIVLGAGTRGRSRAHGLNQGAGGNRRGEEEAPSRNDLQEEAGGCCEHGVSNTNMPLDVPSAVSGLALAEGPVLQRTRVGPGSSWVPKLQPWPL